MPDQKPHSRLDQFTAKYEPLADYQEGAFQKIPIAKIGANPFQPRRYFDQEGLLELARSIKDKGVLQPVIVRRRQDGSVHLVAGERRLRAAKIAGLEEIPCVLTRGNPDEIALIENLQRENLKPIEEAEALAQMMDQHRYTQETLAQVVGKSKSLVSDTLSLNQLPEKIKDQCRQSDACPRQLLIKIARQKTPKAMLALFNQSSPVPVAVWAGCYRRYVVFSRKSFRLLAPVAAGFPIHTSATGSFPASRPRIRRTASASNRVNHRLPSPKAWAASIMF
jgi:ParB/RepB/Spo0J family partition protein